MEWMRALFSYVCGQVHLWSVGRDLLPFCQRCTGLYVGGCYATVLLFVFRPAASVRLLTIHTVCLLQMAPFGYHMVPQGPILRTITGQFFGSGLAYLLCFNPLAKLSLPTPAARWRSLAYALAAVTGIPFLLVTIRFGGPVTSVILAILGTAGLSAFAALSAANVVMMSFDLFQWARRIVVLQKYAR